MTDLARFYRDFSAVLEAPPVEREGRLVATRERYPASLVDEVADVAGLEVYQRQAWFRLVEVMSSEYPLVASLLGPRRFRALAIDFLRARPPRCVDIAAVADGFDEDAHVRSGLPSLALAAAQLDAAWRAVWRSPPSRRWTPSDAERGRLATARLRPSPARRFVRVPWALVEARHALARGAAAVVPDESHAPCDVAILLDSDGIRSVRLEPVEARLLALLDAMPLGPALARLEAQAPAAQRGELPVKVRGWLARAMELGAWSGID